MSNNSNSVDDEINNFIKQNSSLIYRTTTKDIGSRAQEGGKEKKSTLDGKFTKVCKSITIFYYFY